MHRLLVRAVVLSGYHGRGMKGRRNGRRLDYQRICQG